VDALPPEPGCVLIALDEIGDEPEGWEIPLSR